MTTSVNISAGLDIHNKFVLATILWSTGQILQKRFERTKEGLSRAKSEGKLLGRPKGSIGKSKLDGKEKEIKEYLKKGVNKQNIARIYGVSWSTIDNFILSRGIAN